MPLDDSPRPPRSGGSLTQRALLQSIVEVARSVYSAAAASVFVVDPATGDLVFEAVSGEGEGELVGTRFPSGTGIAGWVASSAQPLLVDDVGHTPQFALDAAESTGYVPQSIMAAPLIQGGECVGVLEVLDRGSRPRGDLGDVELLGLLATELAMALEVLIQFRWLEGAAGLQDPAGTPESEPLAGGQQDLMLLQRIARQLRSADPAIAGTARRLLSAAGDVLAGAGS